MPHRTWHATYNIADDETVGISAFDTAYTAVAPSDGIPVLTWLSGGGPYQIALSSLLSYQLSLSLLTRPADGDPVGDGGGDGDGDGGGGFETPAAAVGASSLNGKGDDSDTPASGGLTIGTVGVLCTVLILLLVGSRVKSHYVRRRMALNRRQH